MVGIAQVAALVPGVSRSGATITAGRALGVDRGSAAVFSFLLSLPIPTAAAVFASPAKSGPAMPFSTTILTPLHCFRIVDLKPWYRCLVTKKSAAW